MYWAAGVGNYDKFYFLIGKFLDGIGFWARFGWKSRFLNFWGLVRFFIFRMSERRFLGVC